MALTFLSQAAAKPLSVVVSATPGVVYSYSEQRCDWRSIPDSPARAYRREDGTLVLLAGHFRNRILEGRGFDSLRPSCSVVSQASESGRPSDYDDRVWIQSLIPMPKGRVLALASQEFSGLRHEGLCDKAPGRPQCWYLSLVALEASEGDFRFTLLPRVDRLIAGSNRRFDRSVDAGGFLTATNTVVVGDDAYFIGWTEDAARPQGRGNCLFRAPLGDLVHGWRVLSGGEFVRPPDAYPADGGSPVTATCDRLGGPDLTGKIRSLVWLETKKLWMAVWSTRVEGAGGVYYATSPDLRNWSAAALMAPLEPPWGSEGTRAFYDYPALIDHDSPSRVFQTAGDRFYLYMTRLNWQQKRPGMDRDLVRFEVRLGE